MNQTLIAFWNWTSITVKEEDLDNSQRVEDIFSLDLSIIIVLSVSLVSIIFCCVLQRSESCHSRLVSMISGSSSSPCSRGENPELRSPNISTIYLVTQSDRRRTRPRP